MEDSTLLRWHSGTQKRVERAKQSDQIDNEARLLWKRIVKTKHQSLTNLAFMQLVPGADRVVRHICIRCMLASWVWNFLVVNRRRPSREAGRGEGQLFSQATIIYIFTDYSLNLTLLWGQAQYTCACTCLIKFHFHKSCCTTCKM